ncbi:beta-N-acetylhexosaminidase [Leifsonia sp. YIM 134122]|uniref:Beta-N-acetylhexosaminidase n=1 Tax=Leifsonia stereocauli TaxID=3134136 RepID=A0ABU9WAL2_9MICO
MSGAATTASVPDSATISSRGELRSLVAATLMPGFVGTELPDWLSSRLRAGLGGVCIFGQNIVSRSQLRELTDAVRAANPRAVIAIDEEGGDVTRLYYDQGSPYPGPAVLGRLDDLQLTERVGRTVAEELAAVGCTLNFAPDADVNSNPDNPVIGVRSFGSDPVAVARHIGAWVAGHEGAGIAVSAKHFPGHGDTAQDSHLALPVIDADLETLRSRELVPFRAAIEAGARTIMTSHILIPQVDAEFPATHSRRILQGLLRDELGFDGVIVSDALDMKGASGIHGIPEAAVRALDAGCDLLCIGTENTDGELDEIEDRVLAAIASGRLSIERVLEAALRVRELGEETNAVLAALDAGSAAASADDATASELAEPVFDTAQVQLAFDVSPHARAWLDAGIEPSAVVRIDTVANIAVGVAPWGPFAELARHPFPADSAWSTPHPLAEGSAALPDFSGPVIVVGKDIHRYAFAREAIDELRANGGAVLVVDLGWPSDDRAYADIATFGASRLLGRSVLALLEGSTA